MSRLPDRRMTLIELGVMRHLFATSAQRGHTVG
jgi:hypothetical protein